MQELIETVQSMDQGLRLDTFWQGILDEEGVPRTRIQHWIRTGRSRINGQVCTKPATRILSGQMLSLQPECSEDELVPDPGPLEIVFADVHLVVVNKEAGLTVHPAPSVCEPTLVHRAVHHFSVLRSETGARPGIVHRLDKDTSGLILLALSESIRQDLTQAFANREVHKEYLAIVAGVPPSSGRITLPLGRHPTIKTRMAVLDHGGRAAETLYQLLWSAPDQSASLVRVCIPTGRTHQIRVHLAALGHPLLGDMVYANKSIASRAPRQMLHAWRLDFVHPATGESLKFSCRPPADFLDILNRLCVQPVRIGLTGAAGSGKTAVSRVVQSQGVPVFCADQAVAQLYAPGQDGAVVLEHHFGRRFLDDQGLVDRSKLLAAMSESNVLRWEVERLIHPLVTEAMQCFFKAHDHAVLLADIPLLFESKMADFFDLVAVVFSPEELRKERLAKRGWSAERVAQTDAWQWSQDRKVRLAALVLDNSGSLVQLETRSLAMIRFARTWSLMRASRQMDKLLAIFDANSFDKLVVEHVSPAR